MLNYCFALLEAEARLALSVLGLDAALGLGLHTDTDDRSSLAFDALEPVRPQVESWLLDWIASEPLLKADFFETVTGNCRLMSTMCTKLSSTASVWGKRVAPWAEYIARSLWDTVKSERARDSVFAARVTHQRRVAKAKVGVTAAENPPKTDHLCRDCGKAITGSMHCANCAIEVSTERLVRAAKLGRVAARDPEASAKHEASHQRHIEARSEWDASTIATSLAHDGSVPRSEFSRYSRRFQLLRLEPRLRSRAGMRVRYGEASARIQGIGELWRH